MLCHRSIGGPYLGQTDRIIERLQRSLEHWCTYLQASETASKERIVVARRIGYRDAARPGSALTGQPPADPYCHGGASGMNTTMSSRPTNAAKPPRLGDYLYAHRERKNSKKSVTSDDTDASTRLFKVFSILCSTKGDKTG